MSIILSNLQVSHDMFYISCTMYLHRYILSIYCGSSVKDKLRSFRKDKLICPFPWYSQTTKGQLISECL